MPDFKQKKVKIDKEECCRQDADVQQKYKQ